MCGHRNGPEGTRRAGVGCVATRTCTHTDVLTTLGRKWEGGGPGDGQREARGPGRQGWRAWWEGAAASLHPLCALRGGSATGAPGAHGQQEDNRRWRVGETPLRGSSCTRFPQSRAQHPPAAAAGLWDGACVGTPGATLLRGCRQGEAWGEQTQSRVSERTAASTSHRHKK